MEHDLELIIARLEILEIGVCNILQNPGNIGKLIFLIQSYPGNIGNLIFPVFPISWKYWKYDFSIFLNVFNSFRPKISQQSSTDVDLLVQLCRNVDLS